MIPQHRQTTFPSDSRDGLVRQGEASSRTALPSSDGSRDPWQWLEDASGGRQLSWVKEHNARVERELGTSNLFRALKMDIEKILDAQGRIPPVVKHGTYLYNFWVDENHQRGLWRRTTFDSYCSENTDWDILLDIDTLNESENEDWVWHGAELLRPRPGDTVWRRALVCLSHSGTDSDTTREFDLVTKTFVPQSAGGFVRADAKGGMSWIDEDTVFIATDFGEGTLTSAGYPRQVRRWRRGTSLDQAELIFEAESSDLEVKGYRDDTPGWERDWIICSRTIYENDQFILHDRPGGQSVLTRIEVPSDLEMLVHRDLALLIPGSDWQVDDVVFPAGSLVVADAESFLAGERDLHMLFAPTRSASLAELTVTRNHVVITILEDVAHRLETHYRDARGDWRHQRVFAQLTGSLEVIAVDDEESDELWIVAADFCIPATLWLGDLGSVGTGHKARQTRVKSSPAFFDASRIQTSQHFALSQDGTSVPYFQIGPKAPPAASQNPTLMYGYGGFEFSLIPSYLDVTGKAWCERGGTYVIANVRGGGEYGPAWHRAALRQSRPLSYQDFAAVARDLVARGVTTPERLACLGASNGGLLVGNMLTGFHDLFAALVLQVPLLDMKRYSRLLAGASWLAEYGDPETDDWEFIRTFSPYHSLDPDVGYPPVLMTTSTCDDRVHPGHARKFAAALEALENKVLIWENTAGGHGGAATNAQVAHMDALVFTFLWQTIGQGIPARCAIDEQHLGRDAD